MLFLILGARMKQALFTINIDNISFADKVILLPNNTLKHTNPNRARNHIHTINVKLKKKVMHCKMLAILSRKTKPPSEGGS